MTNNDCKNLRQIQKLLSNHFEQNQLMTLVHSLEEITRSFEEFSWPHPDRNKTDPFSSILLTLESCYLASDHHKELLGEKKFGEIFLQAIRDLHGMAGEALEVK